MKTIIEKSRARSGFTLLEITIAIAILGLILGAMTGVLDSARQGYIQGSATVRTQSDSRRALDRIATELENGGLGTLTPNPIGVAAPSLMFQVVTGIDVATDLPVLENPSRLQFLYESGETNNGLDDDGDGLIDEGRVVMTRDVGQATEKSTTLVTGVSELLEGELANGIDDNANGFVDESGFCMTLEGRLLVIRLSLSRPVKQARSIVSTVETAVRFKN